MARLFDMAKMTVSGTPGTGTITLGSAVSGFQTFADAGVTDGVTVSYSIIDGSLWEVGRGVYTAAGTTLTRGPLFSSSGGSAVNLTSAAIIWIAILNEDLIQSVILTGNTAGTSAPIISPILAFAGGNNVTLSGTSNTISIIGPVTVAQSAQTLGLFAVGNTTGTTSSQTRDARTISFDGAGIVSVGFSAGSIIISATDAAQTAAGLSLYAVGNTTSSVSSGVNEAGSLSFDGAGIVSVGISNSSIVISAPSPPASQGSLSLYAVGNTTVSSSTSSALPEALSLSGAGGVTVGYSSNTIILSGATTVAQSVQTLGLFAVGNTTGTTSSETVDARTISFDGAGIASVGFSAGSVIISATSAASGVVQNEYAIGNTTALSSSTTQTLSSVSYSGAGIVSIGYSTTAAGAGALVISAPASQGSLSLYAVGNTTVSSSTSSVLPEALSFSGTGNLSIGYSSNTIIFSAGTVAAGAQTLYAVGNTTDSTSSGVAGAGTLSFDGAGLVSIGISDSSIVISGPTTVGAYAVGNTTAQTSSIASHPFLTGNSSNQISGAGIVSVGFSTVSASDTDGTTTTRYEIISASSRGSLSLYAVGNTTVSSSTSSILPEALSLSGAGIVTVGYSSNTVLLSATTAASQGSLSLYAVGNTTVSSSTSSALPEALSISGAGIVTVGYSSNTILVSVTTAATNPLVSVYAVGNTTSSVSSGVNQAGSISFDGAGLISVGVSNSSIVISGPTTVGGYAVGNTTAATSSISWFPFLTGNSSNQISGAGIVSVGFSTVSASDTDGTTTTRYEVISASSRGSLSLFAVGNTTISSSTSSALPEALSLSGAGIITVGYSSNTLLFSATTAASGVVQNQYAIGNTTAATSSTTQTLSSVSFSGAGIVSVGYSTTAAGVGAIVISASTAATNPLLSIYAVGNTTSDASSGLNQAGSLSFDGAGIVSVGIAGSSVVISAPSPAASGTAQNRFADGNTFGQSSSAIGTLTSLRVSATGGISAGFSTDASSGVLMLSVTPPVASGTAQNRFAGGNSFGQSSSAVGTLSSFGVSATGGISAGFSTDASSAYLMLSVVPPVASGTIQNQYFVGNTTVASSGTQTLSSVSYSGLGIVSVGYSGNAIAISATTAASGTVQNRFAGGNSFGQSSSAVGTLSSLIISATGGISVGYSTDASSAAIMLSVTPPVASGVIQNQYAIGNTTAQSSSTTQTLSSISLSGAGAVSVGFSTTAAGAGAYVISSPATIASGTVGNYFASGNTTAISSSSTHTLSNISISGAGIVSVGVSTTGAGAGIVVISASTAATNPLLSLYAVGNTTSSVSSGVNAAGSLSFDGAGIVSVGISNSSIVISAPTPAASATAGNYYAIGNTTGLSSSSTMTLSSISMSGVGGASVGFSTTAAGAGAYQVSVPLGNLSLFAVGNTTISSSTSSVLPEALSFSGAGIATVGYSSNTILLSVTSGTNQSQYLLGNTTALSSSSTQSLTSVSFSGAGIVSLGLSTTAAGAGALIISAPASQGSLSLFAVGNTTVSSSTSSVLPEALSFSGAGNVTVGYSSNTIIVSAGTVAPGPLSMFAVGNTTAVTSSVSISSGSMTFDALGALSVGFSNSSIVMSMPATSSLVGTSGVSLSTNGSTISIFQSGISLYAVGNTTSSVSSGANAAGSISFAGSGLVSVGISQSSVVISGALTSNSYFEPSRWVNTSTTTWASGTMAIQPFTLNAPLTMNQVNFMSSRAVVAPAATIGASTASRTVTASVTWGSTASLYIYSRQGGTSSLSYTTFSSTTASFGMSAAYSASYSTVSRTVSQTVTFGWPQGTSAASTSSMSTTFSSNTATTATFSSQVMHTSSSLFSGWLRNDYPFAASFPPGDYLLGVLWMSGSGSSTLSTGLITVAAPTWLGTDGVNTGPALTVNLPGVANANTNNMFPGVGIISSAGSVAPATVAWQNVTSQASNPRDYFYMNMGGS